MKHIAFLSLAAAALAVLTTPVTADCPVAGGKKGGITLAQYEPFFMRSDIKITGEGFVEQRVFESGGQAINSMTPCHHGLAMMGKHSPSGHVEITCVDKIAPMDRRSEEGKVAVSGIAKGAQGEAFVELDVAFSDKATRANAGCAIEAWRVITTLTDCSGVGASFRMDIAPELNLVPAAHAPGDDGMVTRAYAYQWAGKTSEIGE